MSCAAAALSTRAQRSVLRGAHSSSSGRARAVRVFANKGFSSGDKPDAARTDSAPSTSTTTTPPLAAADASIEAIEERLRSRRARRRVEPQVKVESAAVAAATGAAAPTPAGALETRYVGFLGIYFVLLLVEGLVLAGSGFLPEAADAFVMDYLYPTYTPTMLGFLGASSLYGAFKVGKLPGQEQPPSGGPGGQ